MNLHKKFQCCEVRPAYSTLFSIQNLAFIVNMIIAVLITLVVKRPSTEYDAGQAVKYRI